MEQKMIVKQLEDIVVLFSGDSGDGMQLAGNIFSAVCAVLGNEICTFPDYPAEIRAPQGTLGGVSGFKIHAGKDVTTPGDVCNVLVAMNPAALKRMKGYLAPDSIIIIDVDTFTPMELKKAEFATENPFEELGIQNEVVAAPLTTMCQNSLKDSGLPPKGMLKCRNMMALGLVCWMFECPLEHAEFMIRQKFAKKPEIADANVKVLNDGYNYAENVDTTVAVRYKIQPKEPQKGTYCEITGNKATVFGLIAAAEKANLPLFLGSYPITPATDILHELAKHKSLGVKTVQCEDEISGCCMAIGASYAGNLAVTSTSGPGLCLKSEAINLATMAELPLVVIDVQRGGPSTGLPTKTEQTDLLQALFGRNGESPVPVISASTPGDCFDTAFMACKVALEHMTPVIVLTDAFVANGSSIWRIPKAQELEAIKTTDVTPEMQETWAPYLRNPETFVRYRAIPGTEGFCHVIGGLEKDTKTGRISYDPKNHEYMVECRKKKVDYIANDIPELEILGNPDADTLLIGWGGTFGHLCAATEKLNQEGIAVAQTHFHWINPMPKNTEAVLRKYKKIIVAELNTGQLAAYLSMKFQNLPTIYTINNVQGQPFTEVNLIQQLKDLLQK